MESIAIKVQASRLKMAAPVAVVGAMLVIALVLCGAFAAVATSVHSKFPIVFSIFFGIVSAATAYAFWKTVIDIVSPETLDISTRDILVMRRGSSIAVDWREAGDPYKQSRSTGKTTVTEIIIPSLESGSPLISIDADNYLGSADDLITAINDVRRGKPITLPSPSTSIVRGLLITGAMTGFMLLLIKIPQLFTEMAHAH